jgi:LysR family transcriptional regulator of gallate degradation
MADPRRTRSGAASPASTPFELNLRHLRGLLAVRQHGSISAAAVAVNLSQPALTQGIAKLESLLGQVLFERRPKGMAPTAAGDVALDRFQAALAQLAVGSRAVAGPSVEPDRRLTMTQLRAFLAVLEMGTFAAAATRIGLSQPAVHRAVRDLEAALDKKLVERRGRSIVVNFAGRRFGRSCRLALNEIQAALSEAGTDLRSPTIAVGTTPLARAFLVPEAMAMMTAEQFPAGFQVLEGSWGELVETLRDGLIDLIVGELPPYDSPDLIKVPLYEESLVIVGGRQHPLVGKSRISLKRLASYPWIIGPENSPLRAEWESLFRPFNPVAPIECGSIMIIGRLLTSSEMLTLAAPDQVALQVRSGLLSRIGEPLTGRTHTIGTTMRQSWRPTSAQRRFLQALEQASLRMTTHDDRKAFIEGNWI